MTKSLVVAVGFVLLACVHAEPAMAEVDTEFPVQDEKTAGAAESPRDERRPEAGAAGFAVAENALRAWDPGRENTHRSAITTVPVAAGNVEKSARGQVDPRVAFETANGGFLITIRMEEASKATLRQDGREVLLSWPHPLPNFNAQTLQDQAAGLLEGVSVGFDTLLLHLAPDVTVMRTDKDGYVQLILRREPGAAGTEAIPGPDLDQAVVPSRHPVEEPVAPQDAGSRAPDTRAGGAQAGDTDAAGTQAGGTDAAANKAGALRLRLLAAQLLAQSGEVSEAREDFENLMLAMPESPEPISGLADVNQRAGRWRQALAFYRQAQELDPEDPSIATAIAAIERAQARRLRTDLEYRQTDGGPGTGRATAAIAGVSGQLPLSEGWRLGFSFDGAQVDVAQVQNTNGTVGSFSGLRQREEIYLQHDGLNGTMAAASVYLTGHTPGFGVRAELPDASGATFLRTDYRRPDWDFFQSLINNGTKDRVALGRRQNLTENLTVRLDVGANRYGIEDAANVASSATVTGELRLGNLAGVRGLSTAYVLDSEYTFHVAERTGRDGKSFAPLQIVDREVHAAVLAYAGAWKNGVNGKALSYELSAGYGVDRYGRAGPILATVLTYPLEKAELGLRAGYVKNIGRSPGTTAIFAVSLTWRF
jgi:hypothetical protein